MVSKLSMLLFKFVALHADFSDLLGGPGLSSAEEMFLSVGFTGCGKKRKAVILSAEFARRISLSLLF
jgi:hypothetical protein